MKITNSLFQFINECKEEVLYKTTWPTFNELMANGVVILVTILLVALVLFIIDSIASQTVYGIYNAISKIL